MTIVYTWILKNIFSLRYYQIIYNSNGPAKEGPGLSRITHKLYIRPFPLGLRYALNASYNLTHTLCIIVTIYRVKNCTANDCDQSNLFPRKCPNVVWTRRCCQNRKLVYDDDVDDRLMEKHKENVIGKQVRRKNCAQLWSLYKHRP